MAGRSPFPARPTQPALSKKLVSGMSTWRPTPPASTTTRRRCLARGRFHEEVARSRSLPSRLACMGRVRVARFAERANHARRDHAGHGGVLRRTCLAMPRCDDLLMGALCAGVGRILASRGQARRRATTILQRRSDFLRSLTSDTTAASCCCASGRTTRAGLTKSGSRSMPGLSFM